MAWIETKYGAVNLDKVEMLHVQTAYKTYSPSWTTEEYLATDENDNFIIIGIEMRADDIPVFMIPSSNMDTEYSKKHDRLIKVTHQIAQIARGNAYISQDDIRRMMDEQN